MGGASERTQSSDEMDVRNDSIEIMDCIVSLVTVLLKSIKSTKRYLSYFAKKSLIWDTGFISKWTAV